MITCLVEDLRLSFLGRFKNVVVLRTASDLFLVIDRNEVSNQGSPTQFQPYKNRLRAAQNYSERYLGEAVQESSCRWKNIHLCRQQQLCEEPSSLMSDVLWKQRW